MKKIIILASILLLAAACSKQPVTVNPTPPTFADTASWQVYKNKPFGFSLLMPKDWRQIFADYKERSYIWLESANTDTQSKAREACLKGKNSDNCPAYLDPDLAVQQTIFRNPQPIEQQEIDMYSHFKNVKIGSVTWFEYQFKEGNGLTFYEAQTTDKKYSLSLTFGQQIPESVKNSILKSFELVK